jgi:phospholipase/lecithinase/hemolysin
MRRALLALAPAAVLALAACGSGTIESQFTPSRMVVFGDAFADPGNTGARYSVNDNGATNLWPQLVGANYGITVTGSASGGTNYATGNARIVLTPDAAGNGAPTIASQIDTFLAGNQFGPGDLVVIEGGFSDMIVQAQAYVAGTITGDQLTANVKQAAHDLAAQAKRLAAAGAQHVVIVSMYDLGKTPWAASINQAALLSTESITFNNTVLVDLVNEGRNMLYIDIALPLNLIESAPTAYSLTDATTVTCNSIDPGPGIGIGTGKVNSKLCTTATINTGQNYLTYLWADPVYLAPTGHARVADYVFGVVRNRW